MRNFAMMKLSILRVFFLLHALSVFAFGSNSVVNLSHYDLMQPDFVGIKSEGIIAVIHEATYPRFERDARYRERQVAAMQAGLLWGAYHFGDALSSTAGCGSRIIISSRAIPPRGINGISGNTVEMANAIFRALLFQKVSPIFARPSGIFFAVTVSPYNSSGRNTPGFRPDRVEQFPLAYALANSTRAREKPCQTICSVSSATRLLRHRVALFVGRLRRG